MLETQHTNGVVTTQQDNSATPLRDSPPSNVQMPTPHECLDMYIASAGQIYLCMERLQKKYPELTEVILYHQLSSPEIQHDLEERTRAQLIMRTFEAANESIIAARQAIMGMSPFERSKAATNFLQQLTELTKKPTEINLNNIIWEQYLPGEAAAAVRYLLQPNQQQQPTEVIDHNPYITKPKE